MGRPQVPAVVGAAIRANAAAVLPAVAAFVAAVADACMHQHIAEGANEWHVLVRLRYFSLSLQGPALAEAPVKVLSSQHAGGTANKLQFLWVKFSSGLLCKLCRVHKIPQIRDVRELGQAYRQYTTKWFSEPPLYPLSRVMPLAWHIAHTLKDAAGVAGVYSFVALYSSRGCSSSIACCSAGC